MKRTLICRGLGLLLGLAAPFFAHAQLPAGVGIGTTAPTQALDVNGSLRVRGLGGTGLRLPTILPDGTLGTNAPIFSTGPVAGPPTAATGIATTSFRPVGVTVSGTMAYVISFDFSNNNANYGFLQTYDIAVPSAPVLLGSTSVLGRPSGIAVSSPRAYVVGNGTATQQPGLRVLSVVPPSNPIMLGFMPAFNSNSLGAVAANGTLAYTVSSSANRLDVFDATSSNSPALLAGIGTGRGPSAVAVSGTTVYVVNADDNTLQLFDVAVPNAPVLLSTIATGNNRNGALASGQNNVAVSGTRAYVVNGDGNTLQVFDVAVPSMPVVLSTVATGNGPFAVAVSGTRAYVTNYYDATLQTFDLATPGDPVLMSTAATFVHPIGVAASGTTACVVSASSNTLQVFGGTPSRLVAVNTDGSLASVVAPPAPALGLSGSDLSIVGGNSVTLPDASATNEAQTLSKTGSTITLSSVTGAGGGSFTDDDNQQLSISGSTLSLSNGGSVALPSSADNLGNHTATQSIDLQGNQLLNVSRLTSPATGSHNLLAVAYGQVAAAGTSTFSSSDNYTVGHSAAGTYLLTFTAASGLSTTDLGPFVFTGNLWGSGAYGFVSWRGATGTLTVYVRNAVGALTDAPFSFAFYKP